MPETPGPGTADYGRAGDAPAETSGLPAVRPLPAVRRPGWRGWRVLRVIAGFFLLGLGIIGLFLPVLQGVLLILAGLAVLGRDLPWARGITDRLRAFIRRRADAKAKRKAAR